MITKTMKYKIKYDKNLYNLLNDIMHTVWLIKNKSVTLAYDWQQFSFSYKERFGDYPKAKEVIGKNIAPDIYNSLKDVGYFIGSSIVDVTVQEVIKKFENDKNKILKGEKSIQNYKKDGSFPLRVQQIKIINKINNKMYSAKFSLLSRHGANERNCKTQVDVEILTGNSGKTILERIGTKEYKLSDSRIGKIKNDFFLFLSYTFKPEQINLDKNKIMGVDLGISKPATLAISDDDYYRRFVGSRQEMESFQKQVESRSKRLKQQRKWCGEGSVGHGRKTRLKPLEKLSGKIANFKDTKNHCWSRYIVDEAVKNGCGVIQMEDLTGIKNQEDKRKNSFLRFWTYYDLQEKITYKAKEKGIEVIKIDPHCTSARCNKCGWIHNTKSEEAKKLWRPRQDKFVCQNCGYGSKKYVNADVNAARNIAMKNIDKIIKEQLDIQKKAAKHAMTYEV